MDILEFHGPHGWLQIFCIVIDKARSPVASEGRQHLRYAVGGHGFSGADDAFVSESELQTFCQRLIALADGADVEAQLPGHEIRGLKVTLKPGPKADQISIEGRIVTSTFRTLKEEDGLYTWATQFGFWVKRPDLAHAHKVNWVRHYAD